MKMNEPWSTFIPPEKKPPWTLRRVVHLHRRAAFAATWSDIQRDLSDGPKASIDRLIAGKPADGRSIEEFERISALLADSAVASQDPGRLKAWWVYRMLFSPDPLGERLTLLWHNHFATSNLKVNDLAAMRRQNDMFREMARAPFGKLLNAAIRDPALLVWLDAPVNRKGHPNENLARESMELFTLGVGHFTEADVKEGARALTGWTVNEGRFEELAKQHDDSEKTILGRKGKWTASDFVKMLLDQPSTAERLATRICELLLGEKLGEKPGEKVVSAEAIKALAEGLRQHQLDIGWAIETVLRSQLFFDERNMGNRVLGPTEYVIGAVRALELTDPPPSTLVLGEWLARLGQDLFYPPNVGGWVGGRAWINTQTVISRANFAAGLVDGKAVGRSLPLDALGLAQKHGRGGKLDDLMAFYMELLMGKKLPPAAHGRIRATLGSTATLDMETGRRAVALILASPEMQLA